MVNKALILLFSRSDTGRTEPLAKALQADGWTVACLSSVAACVAQAGSAAPAVILADGSDQETGDDLPDLVRRLEAAACTTPLIAYGLRRPPRSDDRRIDDHVASDTPNEVVDAIRRWRPGDLLAGARRLEAAFGHEAIGGMIAGFRAQLADAIYRHDRGDDAGLAHRVAGLAGTLGFAEVSREWLALSEGDAGAWEGARRAARMALAAIDRAAGQTVDRRQRAMPREQTP